MAGHFVNSEAIRKKKKKTKKSGSKSKIFSTQFFVKKKGKLTKKFTEVSSFGIAKVDQINQIALISSIGHEFHTLSTKVLDKPLWLEYWNFWMFRSCLEDKFKKACVKQFLLDVENLRSFEKEEMAGT